MATWKEKGIVPDSDDEDDLESQSISSLQHENEERNNGVHDYPSHEEGIELPANRRIGDSRDTLSLENVSQNSEATAQQNTLQQNSQRLEAPRQYISTPTANALSSPIPPKFFKVPELSWEEYQEVGRDGSSLKPADGILLEEISKSYVRITSLGSSILSSPPSSQVLPLLSDLGLQTLSNLSGDEYSEPPVAEDDNGQNSQSRTQEEILYPVKRRFRQRNPIQLHPYIVEQEKYRQTLKARGIAPMRIALSQDERSESRDSAPSDHDTQELESLEMLVDQPESQTMDFDWDPPASSPPVALSFDHESGVTATAQVADADDEFPDIEDLLRSQPVSKAKPKSAMKSYSKGFHRHKLSHTHSRQISNLPSAIVESLDTPASPPPTSPPVVPSKRRLSRPLSRISSTASKSSISLSVSGNTRNLNHNADLPTPATSAMKPNLDPIFLDSSSDSDDPFASDHQRTPSSESSSDESLQLRRVGKKIRGVLPASHLRLDVQKKKPQAPIRTEGDILGASPVKILARKGIAIPRSHKDAHNTPDSIISRLPFLSDDSEEESDEDRSGGIVMEEDDSPQLSMIFSESRSGFAEENDSIDAMFPSRKRQSSNVSRPYKKRKVSVGKDKRQPRITEHLKRPRSTVSISTGPSKRRRRNEYGHSRNPKATISTSRPAPPRLSILDVIVHNQQDGSYLPQFIKIAARTARSQKDKGRQSPTKKFIRLATREDTLDVQSVLEDWRGGRILPKITESQEISSGEALRTPLGPLNDNRQSKLPSPSSKIGPRSASGTVSESKIPKLAILVRGVQQTMRKFVTQQPVVQLPKHTTHIRSSRKGHMSQPKLRYRQLPARPAQLESSRIDFSRRDPSAAFNSTKRVLDALYHNSRKRATIHPNIPLSRFLADEDIIHPSIEVVKDIEEVDLEHSEASHPPQRSLRRRKRSPKRIDAEAAIYRQPSHPLVLDFLLQEQKLEGDYNNKLLGLGKFGTKYPVHFDISPLQRGIFFHKSTLLGSGRLRSIISNDKDTKISACSPQPLKLGKMEFSWTTWDETTSSEVGVCFDWLFEQLPAKDFSISSQPSDNLVEVVIFIMDYAQYHVRFNGTLSRKNFLSRMILVVRDFSSRLDTKKISSIDQTKPAIEVLTVCSIFVFMLLKMSRNDPESNSLTYEVEDLLKSVASCCIRLLLTEGLESIRKLYNDLQYLSFREIGIKNDQYHIQAWVTLIQILNAASIPKSSFWDVTNSHLQVVAINNLNDAPTMENLWYTLYTLLPLCEFNEFGVVVPSLRETLGFDNWALPQLMLKRLCSLYRTNQRQPLGFNDYCKSIFTRCHYLMIEWGWWKCSSIVGTMFDFFASQNLSHLRNEEVYHSPHFLEELDTEPSLAVEPEDHCFHIFLKVTALGIKHLRGLDDIKSIRNLVARVLPNHDRQYPMEEAVHQRDLASLRNHHDLLCTLFWTAPPDQRPPVSLIQELVIADRSHKEACLISLKAWENLTLFVVTGSGDPTAYRPFVIWQLSFFNAIYHQYTSAEAEVRQQADILQQQTGEVMSETCVLDTIQSNKRSIIVSMCRSVNAMGNIIKSTKSDIMLKQVLSCELLFKALDPVIHNDQRISDSLLREVVLAISYYIDQANRLCPIALETSHNHNVNEDSQDSLDLAEANWGRMELTIPLSKVAENLSPVLRKRLEASSSDSNQSLNGLIINCWARLVSILTEDEPQKLQSFLANGKNAIFENRSRYRLANESWPLFLANLLEHNKNLKDFPAGFNIGLEWLLSLINPQPVLTSEKMLTLQLYTKGHYLCTAPELQNSGCLNILRVAIRRMSTILLEKSTDHTIGLPHRIAQRLFSDMLGEVMKAIQQFLESMEPGTESHKSYLEFAQAVITDIKCYASDFRPLTEFFVHPSSSYWPHDADPNLYAAGLVAYSIRLNQQPEKTSFELFYYLHGGWKSALIANRLQNYCSHIKKGMRRWDFARFMFSEFIPSVLDAGFRAGGWLLCQIYLPAISQRIGRLLDKIDANTTWAFEHSINLIKIIMNGIKELFRRFQHNTAGVNPNHRGTLAVVLRFWFSIAPYMRQYVERYPSRVSALEEVTESLSRFIYNLAQAFDGGNLNTISFPGGEYDTMKGKLTDKFTAVITQDIRDYWHFIGEDGFDIVVSNRSKEQSAPQLLTESLGAVLEGGLVGYEALFEDKEGVQLPKRKYQLVADVFC